MLYHAVKTEAAGTTRTGFKTGLVERLAAGALVLSPLRDHDGLGNELCQQRIAESWLFDVSGMPVRPLSGSPRGESMLGVLPVVVYTSTDPSAEPPADLVDQAIAIIADVITRPSRPERTDSPSVSAFLIVSRAPEQKLLRYIVSRMLGGPRDLCH